MKQILPLSSNLRRLIWFVIPLTIFSLIISPAIHLPGPPQEEGEILSGAMLLNHGYVLYRDLNFIYGPLGIWLVAGAFKVFGYSLFVERAIGVAYYLIFTSSVFLLFLRRSLALALLCSLFCVIYAGASIEGAIYAWPFAGALAFSFLGFYFLEAGFGAKNNKNKFLSFLGGLSFSMVLLLRFDFALSILAVIIISAIRFKKTELQGFGYLVGGLLVALAGYTYEILRAGLAPIINLVLINPRQQLAGNYLPLPPPTSYLASFPNRAMLLPKQVGWFVSLFTLSFQLVLWFYFALFGLGIALVATIYFWKKKKFPEKPWLISSLCLFCIFQLPDVLQRADNGHILALVVIVVILDFFTFYEVQKRWHVFAYFSWLFLATFVISLIFVLPNFLMAPFWRNLSSDFMSGASTGFFVKNNGLSFIVSSVEQQKSYEQLFSYLDTVGVKNQKLYVTSGDPYRTPYNDTELYYLFSQFKPATKYIILYPFVGLRDFAQLTASVKNANIVILDSVYSFWHEDNQSDINDPPNFAEMFFYDFCLSRTYGQFSVYFNRFKDNPRELIGCQLQTQFPPN